MSKTTIYIVLIIALLGANLFLILNDGSQSSSLDKSYLEAYASQEITEIRFTNNQQQEVALVKSEGAWRLNEKYSADENFINTLLSILPRIEVVRDVGEWEGELLGEIELYFGENGGLQFQFASNLTKTKSYFINDGAAQEVVVPGYRDNVVDVFTLHPDQWRNRMVFDGSWRSIQKLTIENSNLEPVEIKFDDQFFMINGNAPQDSSAVVDYLNQFQYFEANEMISKGRFPRFDSLLSTDPMAVLMIEDIKSEDEISFQIYPSLRGQAYHLVTKGEKMMVIDARRVQRLLATSQDFLGSN